MKDEIPYNYSDGYFNSSSVVTVPDGAFITPSSGIIHNRQGKPFSFLGRHTIDSAKGGNRAFALDQNLVGVMGKDITSKKAVGNMVQGYARSLWFVGNTIGDSDAVRVMSGFPSAIVQSSIGALSTIPQRAKYNGSGWNSPTQVGLAPMTTAPILSLTTSATRDASFTGLLIGSLSMKIANKREGTVSIASGASNVVTANSDTVYAYIPDYPEDGSAQADRSWFFYFTPVGFGSQEAHLLFPIEVPESKLDGTDATGWTSSQGNAKIKVISQHASDQNQRIVEIEYNTNDLLSISPFTNYYPADSCKYIAMLGNVSCLIGTGDDGTGFDVSFPNAREAFNPDWRDWLPETPVSIAPNTEMGVFWIMGANTTYQARWTGATQESAPVVLTEASVKYGAIGEGASVCVNGVLYILSSGKTPVRISPDRQVDDQFGSRVRDAFSAFDSTTQMTWDEETNSVIFFYNNNHIAYQIDSDKWSSPFQLPATVLAAFNIGGRAFFCSWNGSTSFITHRWNDSSDSDTINWRLVSKFQTGQSGISLKDIIEIRAILEESGLTAPTITFKLHKNYDTSSPTTIATQVMSGSGQKITIRKTVEALDYETIALEASGTVGGETVYFAYLIVDIHSIERAS